MNAWKWWIFVEVTTTVTSPAKRRYIGEDPADLVSAALDPQDRETGFESLGASFPPNTSKHNGATGALSFQVNLKGKSTTTVWFAMARSNVDKKEASDALTTP